jgi:hypothetical protein
MPFLVTATMADPLEFLKVTTEKIASERSLLPNFALWLSKLRRNLMLRRKLNVTGGWIGTCEQEHSSDKNCRHDAREREANRSKERVPESCPSVVRSRAESRAVLLPERQFARSTPDKRRIQNVAGSSRSHPLVSLPTDRCF